MTLLRQPLNYEPTAEKNRALTTPLAVVAGPTAFYGVSFGVVLSAACVTSEAARNRIAEAADLLCMAGSVAAPHAWRLAND